MALDNPEKLEANHSQDSFKKEVKEIRQKNNTRASLIRRARSLIERAQKATLRDLLSQDPAWQKLLQEEQELVTALHKVRVTRNHKNSSRKSHLKWAEKRAKEISELDKRENELKKKQDDLRAKKAVVQQVNLTKAADMTNFQP